MGISEFNVTAAKAETATATAPAAMPAATEGPWRHFVCVVPARYGLRCAVQVNTLEMEAFKNDFRLDAPLLAWKPPEGFSAGEEWSLVITAEQVLHPERILSEQSVITFLRAAVQLLDLCLGRKIDRDEFLRRLNGLGLPVAWRNELADGIFAASAAGASPAVAADADADIEALLATLAPAEAPAEQFISAVGRAGTGFALDAAAAQRFRDGMAGWLLDWERGLLEHPSAAGPLGLALGLHRVLKLMRGPKHLHLHLLPESLPPEEYEAHWRHTLAGHPGAIEAWIYLAGDTPDAALPPSAWQARLAAAPVSVLLQARAATSGIYTAWGKTLPAPVYVFSGGVAAAVGDGHCAYKPAALAYVEALLEQQARLPAAAGEALPLENADVDPSTRSSTDAVYDSQTMLALRLRGLNIPVGFKHRAGVVFQPLVPAVEAA